jgi:hypothetical protein
MEAAKVSFTTLHEIFFYTILQGSLEITLLTEQNLEATKMTKSQPTILCIHSVIQKKNLMYWYSAVQCSDDDQGPRHEEQLPYTNGK